MLSLLDQLFLRFLVLIFSFYFFSTSFLFGQNFYREKMPKTIFFQASLGAGTFFSAPRPSYDSLVNALMPSLQLGLGKRFSDHFLVQTSAGFQPYSTKEYVVSKENPTSSLEPVFDGFSYNFEVIPTFSILPSYHHMSRPIINIRLGVGLGCLFT